MVLGESGFHLDHYAMRWPERIEMTDQYIKLQKKVTTLLTNASTARVARAQAEPDRTEAREAIRKALQRVYGNESSRNLAFHLIDWTYDAAFILALAMFPEKFNKKEVTAGIECLLAHVPNHVFAAAKISGDQCTDIWGEKSARKRLGRKRPTKHRRVLP